mgnify:CR=1 FL=1
MHKKHEVKLQRVEEADMTVVAYAQLIVESHSIMVRMDLIPRLESAIADLRAALESE